MDFRERIGTLRRDVAGEVILPEDAAYERHRKVWNADFDLYPAMIVRASRVDDVVAALAFARDADLEITVRGGGHSFSGQSVADGALMIDLRRLCAVNVDAPARRARVQAGATWREVDEAMRAASQREGAIVRLDDGAASDADGVSQAGHSRFAVVDPSGTCVEVLTRDRLRTRHVPRRTRRAACVSSPAA